MGRQRKARKAHRDAKDQLHDILAEYRELRPKVIQRLNGVNLPAEQKNDIIASADRRALVDQLIELGLIDRARYNLDRIKAVEDILDSMQKDSTPET